MEISSCLNCGLSSYRERRYMLAELGPEFIQQITHWIPQQQFSDEDYICNHCLIAIQRSLDETKRSLDEKSSLQRFGHERVCAWCGKSILRIRSHALHLQSPERFLIAQRISPRQVPDEARVCYACWVAVKRNLQRSANVDATRSTIHVTESVPSTSAEADNTEEPPQVHEQLEILQNPDQSVAGDTEIRGNQ